VSLRVYCLLNSFFALFLLVVFSPVLVVVTLLIRVDSPGPAIFKQIRVGQCDRLFTLYKFRTMHVGTPDLPSEMIPESDSRFTRLGKFLRRFSLDELPQLVNIIKGDMNFVGPRPALYNQDKLIAMRNEVGVDQLRPGITGWAQVNGRENISLERKVELDKYYFDNRTLSLDFKILWFTIVKSLGGVDLYLEKSTNGADHKEKYPFSL
jgi:O-antigen biosynthesis protein WbqP